MNTEFTFFRIQHYKAVYALWQLCEGVGLSHADSRDCIEAYLARNPDMSFIAYEEKRIVGAILAGHDGRRGYIHHLAVDPSRRRQGIGRRLVNKAMSAIASAGVMKAHLFLFNNNNNGTDFWKASGWTLRGDLGVMSKTIAKDQ